LPLRHYSRLVVRQLGILDGQSEALGLSNSQCHSLIELEQSGNLTAGELADTLNLDRSTMSRICGSLVDAGLIEEHRNEYDGRLKQLALTEEGRRTVAAVHERANANVEMALALLKPEERQLVVTGMALYAKALSNARLHEGVILRPIEERDDAEMAKIIRSAIVEHKSDLPGTAFHDPEVSCMHTAYAVPGTAYSVLESDGRVIGGAGFAPLVGGEEGVCELRKMYLTPTMRGRGFGRILLEKVLEAAKSAGYRRCYLESFDTMTQAQRLYEQFGFVRLTARCGSTGHYACEVWYQKNL
jgi:putative acetyltransferase